LAKATTSLTLLTEIEGVICKVRVMHVGGTLEKVEKAIAKKSEKWLLA